jgi:hypothetical protein
MSIYTPIDKTPVTDSAMQKNNPIKNDYKQIL